MSSPLRPSFVRTVPHGDNLERSVCEHCGHVNYQNPKIVTGAVVRDGDHVLMCRRAIEPRRGFWTIPAGYLELNETPEEGARREALEEANAELELISLLAVYTVPRLSQVQLIYRAQMQSPEFRPGPESLEVEWMAWSDIPWKSIAFPTVIWALRHDRMVAEGKLQGPFFNPPGESTDLPPEAH